MRDPYTMEQGKTGSSSLQAEFTWVCGAPGEAVTYPDVDLKTQRRSGRRVYTHKNGEPY